MGYMFADLNYDRFIYEENPPIAKRQKLRVYLLDTGIRVTHSVSKEHLQHHRCNCLNPPPL